MPLLHPLHAWLQEQQFSPLAIDIVDFTAALTLLGLLALILSWLSRRLLVPWLERMVTRSRLQWDDTLAHVGLFKRVGQLIPLLGCYITADILFADLQAALPLLKRLLIALLVIIIVRVLNTVLAAIQTIYGGSSRAKHRPIRSYLDALQIIIYVLAGIFIVATLSDQSPWGILSVLGGLTAVFLLIFRTSLLGFVANLQLTSNNMMKVGDWITMDKFHADGTVEDISLHTVRVRNWDNTYTTIPTYAFMEDSFQNWRGMSESGGRRIKRSLFIDMTSVRFCSPEMLAHLQKFHLLRDYLQHKEEEIAAYNATLAEGEIYNGRRQTNLGVFRAYVETYLRANNNINTDLTFLIRHLAPTSQGLPLEIYVFSRDKLWANYERIQADIFDHLLAIIPEFGLRVFQYPSGNDLQRLSLAGQQQPS